MRAGNDNHTLGFPVVVNFSRISIGSKIFSDAYNVKCGNKKSFTVCSNDTIMI
jgi:hypothetical protein